MNAQQRKATYASVLAVIMAVIALLVGYGVLNQATAALWGGLASAIVAAIAPVLALRNITPDDVPAGDESDGMAS